MLSRGVPSDEILWLHDLLKIKILKNVKRGQKHPKAKKLRPNILEAKFG